MSVTSVTRRVEFLLEIFCAFCLPARSLKSGYEDSEQIQIFIPPLPPCRPWVKQMKVF